MPGTYSLGSPHIINHINGGIRCGYRNFENGGVRDLELPHPPLRNSPETTIKVYNNKIFRIMNYDLPPPSLENFFSSHNNYRLLNEYSVLGPSSLVGI